MNYMPEIEAVYISQEAMQYTYQPREGFDIVHSREAIMAMQSDSDLLNTEDKTTKKQVNKK